jgi:hypothetical protein
MYPPTISNRNPATPMMHTYTLVRFRNRSLVVLLQLDGYVGRRSHNACVLQDKLRGSVTQSQGKPDVEFHLP